MHEKRKMKNLSFRAILDKTEGEITGVIFANQKDCGEEMRPSRSAQMRQCGTEPKTNQNASRSDIGVLQIGGIFFSDLRVFVEMPSETSIWTILIE
jgi:hypothetical protein